MEIKVSFWNYQRFPDYDTFEEHKNDRRIHQGDCVWYHQTMEEIVEDFRSLGITHAMSFVYNDRSITDDRHPNGYNHRKEDVIAFPDACHAKGIKDGSTRWAVTNNSQTTVTNIEVTKQSDNGEVKVSKQWLLPGQMWL